MPNTVWSVSGRTLLKDGSVFFIRGINYQPTPIGKWGGGDLLLEPHLWRRDLPLLRNLNANAVKVYNYRPGNVLGHVAFLDAAYNAGFNPLYVMFSVWVPPTVMQAGVPLDSPLFQTYVAAYLAMATEVSCHPGTMGFVIAGEINFYPDVTGSLFWQKFNALTQATRTGMSIAGCANTKIITSNFIDDYGQTLAYGEQNGATVDVWGIDVYDNRFSAAKVQAQPGSLSGPSSLQYGVPYASNAYEVFDQTQWNVGGYLMTMANFLESNFMRRDDSKMPVLVGGFVFEYSDEWWKEANPGVHDMAHAPPGPFLPLGYFAEEHFGIFSIAATSGPDTMTPRTIAAQLGGLWSTKIDGQPWTSLNALVFPASVPPMDHCNASSADIAVGLSVYNDPICGQGGAAMGCRNAYCRICRQFWTPQSAPYVGCPPPIATATSPCVNTTMVCANGMVLFANATCQFDACPTPVCAVDNAGLQQGLGSIYDPVCVTNIQADGCDVYRRGCRLCRQPGSRNTVYADCPVAANAPAPCIVTQADLNVGIDVTLNPSCAANGGIGCDPWRPSCQFCKFRVSAQSTNLLPCPGVNVTQMYSSQLASNASSNVPPASTLTGIAVICAVVAATAVMVLTVKAVQARLARQAPRKDQIIVVTPRGPHIL
ncbi:hypothetical protein SPRG_13217 [Saprolegnia parasitica CBS 223.65]|uniref:Glycoside hydrolase family 5 domain-containing protein n=1 Tax=Saprolegnia parasitica (strain CBS 223.65) TaxID=695850 RepID=A0A067C455_SAPPC|nr:hypothetical protein SPRG_13217 [Saprolegnia parasitica CBS 223.65]KDO21326.1 hypothetical protein SPRG_13217 [Saprolegnia parasitica CBS 223.65]|eukprot:XP_012207981.1 hypothetical protein SPRG_13217 [Saprolegnia parasitica CBS 223.65]